jgi:hypothetical protein
VFWSKSTYVAEELISSIVMAEYLDDGKSFFDKSKTSTRLHGATSNGTNIYDLLRCKMYKIKGHLKSKYRNYEIAGCDAV